MRKFAAFALLVLFVLALGIAGCGKNPGSNNGGGNTVSMNDALFATTSVTINAGQSVTFTNSSGSTHLLCLGSHQSCNTSIKDGPSALSVSSGHEVQFGPNDTKTYTFPTKGDFPVTCTVHSNMDMVVHVK